MDDIGGNLRAVRRAVEAAAKNTGRAPDSVRLLAVSKGHGIEAVEAALKAGQLAFGENRVQDAKAKFMPLRDQYADLQLHLIGPLQTNKAEDAVRLFDVIETLDRLSLADALAKAIHKVGRAPKLYIEVNIGREHQKAGIPLEDLDGFLAACRERALQIGGLMCIPPQADDPAPHFKKLKELAVQHKLPDISMGMSGDFETAIACGSTEVRIGTAIFGSR
jgi:pyridoxal phosphate enzyme (YggS family)